MTLARRLAKLEATRTPTEIVLAWLAEAQAYPTLPEYLASLLDEPKATWPLYRIATQVETAVRARARGPEDEIWQAVRRCVGDAYFLFELVLRCNLAARAVCDYEGLRWALLCQWRVALALEAELRSRNRRSRAIDDDHVLLGADDWRATLALSLTALYAEDAARRILEQRFFEGRPLLFPGLAQERADLVARLEALAESSDLVPELRVEDAPPLCLEELRQQAAGGTETWVSELLTLARAEALGMIGEHERVFALLERQQRRVVAPAGPSRVETGTGPVGAAS